jgi:valine--pyruvate aminotransferase
MLAGQDRGKARRILFPIVPEYIGYADQGIGPGLFRSCRPRIEHLSDHRFKYRIDFDALEVGDDIAAICISRPTNPTANLVTDNETRRLADLAKEKGIHLMIDNAYGAPFPNVVFKPVELPWNENVILTFSLSKLGLPGTRTGIVVASREIISKLSVLNAIVLLAPTTMGQRITQPLLADGTLEKISREVIQPFYLERSTRTREWIDEFFNPDLDYHVHASEGAFFLWLWMRGLPTGDRALYERLKARSMIVVPGSYFFSGLDEPWEHSTECLRLSYCRPLDEVREGVKILAEEVEKAYR